ncbi:metallophosphatase family protein [Cyclobacteriaceae bacterium]|nr:metallophosphatase family protein [Cyclobacteriaceae bacterium]
MKIGLISDTHSYIDDRILHHFQDCNEIWHAGDIGDYRVIDQLRAVAPIRAVYGNIDGQEVRVEFPEHLKFTMNGVKVWMTHIGGYPGKYYPKIRTQVYTLKPDLFICGHSHILKVMKDKKTPNLIHLNPGAAGNVGFHKMRTVMKFDILEGKIANLQAIELGPRSIINQED